MKAMGWEKGPEISGDCRGVRVAWWIFMIDGEIIGESRSSGLSAMVLRFSSDLRVWECLME